MRGDTIIVEAHHRKAAEAIISFILPEIQASPGKYIISVAGESGSGKSETATAILEALTEHGISSAIFQQDDYFVYPPKTNDTNRRKDIGWVGPREVRLDLLDEHLQAFLADAEAIEKPLVIYETDTIASEEIAVGNVRVAIAEGTYTSLLDKVGARVFIDRDYSETRVHREKRKRDKSELDPFIDEVLIIEHGIISSHKSRADIVINADYSVTDAR